MPGGRMENKEKKSYPGYVNEALHAFKKIMGSNKRNFMDDLNRANKGEMFVLHFLHMSEKPVMPSELRIALGSSMARVSALLGSLEKKGQIKREVNLCDRRNILVTLTEAGKRRALMEMAHMQACMAGIFEEMGEEDTREFIRLAARFSIISKKHMRLSEEDETRSAGSDFYFSMEDSP